MSAVSNVESPWRAGWRSARANVGPGLVLQGVALLIVTAYYRHAPTQAALTQLTEWRAAAGVIFPVLSTGFFGGLLPALYLRARRATRNDLSWSQAGAITLFWSYKGLEVDLFYRLLARGVGEGHDLATIVTKGFIDQFLYCPLVAVPVTVIVYDWVQRGFDGAAVRADMRAGGWVRRKIVPLLISNLGVWLPTVCIIYALPTPLQLPMQNLVLCFFTLLIAHQTRRAV